MEAINIDDLICPSCGARHSLSTFASYERHLQTYDNGEVQDNIITISRYICSSCGHTHAILPPEIETFIINFFKQNGLSFFQGKDFQETS